MKKLLAVTPFLLLAAMPLAGCNTHDAAANNAAVNDAVVNDEGSLDGNGTGDVILNADGPALDNAAADNVTTAPSNAQ